MKIGEPTYFASKTLLSTPYLLKSELSITLYCQLYVTAVQIKRYSKGTSVIKVATMKNMDNFHYADEAGATYKSTVCCQQKMNGMQMAKLVSPRRMHTAVCKKGISPTTGREKIKP